MADIPRSASSVYQQWLDATADRTLGGDAPALTGYVSLPYLHRSLDTQMMVETAEDFALGVTSYAASLQALGVNQFIRLVSDAEFLSDDYIEGHHITHVLRNGAPLITSFANRMVLRRGPKQWKMTEIESAIFSKTWPVSVLTVPDDFTGELDSAGDDARREAAAPVAIYQTFLNALTRANVKDDFEGYCALCQFPYTTHGRAHDAVLSGPEDVRDFFGNLSDMLAGERIEEFLRIADHAEFISAHAICGYHTTRFLRGGSDVLEPIKSRMILRRDSTHWKLASVTNAISNDHFPYRVPQVDPVLVTQREIQERTKTWPNLH